MVIIRHSMLADEFSAAKIKSNVFLFALSDQIRHSERTYLLLPYYDATS